MRPWRAVDETGLALEEGLQLRRDEKAAKRLLRRSLKIGRLAKIAPRPPERIVADEPASCGAAKRAVAPASRIAPARASATAPRTATWRCDHASA